MDQNNSYVSCIKIQGVPILPPLITTERRRELREYKNRALLLEKLYSTRKLNNQNFENENEEKNKIQIDPEALILAGEQSYNIKDIGSPMKYVPFKNENTKTLNLSSSILDVSEYSLDKKDNFENPSMNEPKLCSILDLNQHHFYKDKYNTNTSNIFSGGTETVLEGNSTHPSDGKEISERPRLIRSNSYTLDNPSPLLLAHLKRQSSVSLSSDQDLTDSCTEEVESTRIKSHKSPNHEKSRSKIFHNSNKENNLEHSEDIKYSIGSATNGISVLIKENQDNQSDSFNQPIVEVITTDIMVQQINITTPITDDLRDKNLIAFLNENLNANADEKARSNSVKEQDLSSDTETELKLILNQIPEIYSSKILDLIEKQRVEQEKGLQNYEISTQLLLDRGDFQKNTTINIHIEDENEKWEKTRAENEFPKSISENIEIIRKARSVSESTTLNLCDSPKQVRCSVAESQSLYFDLSTSCSDPVEDFSSKTVKILEHEGEDGVDCRSLYNKMYLDYLTESNEQHNSVDRGALVTDEKILQKERENNAASIIGAYVKGYLVRRLMKTVRVQALIQTIQDALLCALELQRLETIEEADVELHRRLIQQVSAACFEFHDVFFDLTIPEQMDIIAIDREKKQRIFPVKTSHSSIDFHPRSRSSSNARLSKSLTKV